MPGRNLAINFMSGQKRTTTSKTSTKKDTQLSPDLSESLQVFARHRHIHDFFQRTHELVNFHLHIQVELLNAYRVLHDPNYHYLTTCPACVAEFITTIYRWYDNSDYRNL